MIEGNIVDITSNRRRYRSAAFRCMDVTIVLKGFTAEPTREDILKQLANDLRNDVSAYVMDKVLRLVGKKSGKSSEYYGIESLKELKT